MNPFINFISFAFFVSICQIVALVEEISRLRSALAALQESHNLRIQQLEERLVAKRQHISRLEARLDKQSEYEDVKKENRFVNDISRIFMCWFRFCTELSGC